MTATVSSLQVLQNALTPIGFATRGCFQPSEEDAVRLGIVAEAANMCSLVLVGNLGGAFWEHFKRDAPNDPDPLDAWTKKHLDSIAAQMKTKVWYPFDKPPLPFLTWASRAEGLCSSPLGLSMHPEYGLWHAYRAVILLNDGGVSITNTAHLEHDHMHHPCDTCEGKPCLSSCPVGAFKPSAYDVAACRMHLEDESCHCNLSGCLARQACPVGAEHAYDPDHQRFHMRAFRT